MGLERRLLFLLIVLLFFTFVVFSRASGDPKTFLKKNDEDMIVKIPGNDFEIPLSQLQKLYLPEVEGSFVLDENEGLPKRYPEVRLLDRKDKRRILITGGAGFVGSHLVDRLMLMGHEVIVIDNFFTGKKENVAHWIGHPHFELIRHDVVEEILVEVDQIYHLASPASPPQYQYNPVKTIKTNTLGTINMLGLARRVKAKFLVASTSEVYGDPEVHPQNEEYWGHVNPIGPRACYDESKRVSETLTFAYRQQEGIDTRVIRIFNTFGPRMAATDGRVVSNFILQALRGEGITIYGDGSQTRSFQYVHDLVSGLIALMESNYQYPVNIGNPDEYTIKEFAEMIKKEINPDAKIIFKDAVVDDPQKRKPDITRAKQVLGWQPQFTVAQGIGETIEYFRSRRPGAL